MTIKLFDLFESLAADFPDARLVGNPELLIEQLSPLESATHQHLSFLSHPKYTPKLAESKAACVVVGIAAELAAARRGAYIVVDDPYYYFARITQIWQQHHRPARVAGIHPTALIDATASIGKDVSIAAFACIGPQAVIADGASIGEHCVIGQGSAVGMHSRLAVRVTLGHNCSIGARCIVHSGVVIGADGFGFAPHEGRWEKIEQLGNVRIGNDVEIGANTCIDRGALQDTVIEDGVKLDNLVQIGHNVRIGAHSALAGCVGVAGSASIGAHCTIGGGAVVLGHLSLADNVHISAASVVTRSLLKAGNYTGLFPIDDNSSWEKNAASLKQLHAFRSRLKRLEEQPNQTPTPTATSTEKTA